MIAATEIPTPEKLRLTELLEEYNAAFCFNRGRGMWRDQFGGIGDRHRGCQTSATAAQEDAICS